MNITFLIGNGFDLNLGMNTRYTDMYDSYIQSEPKNEIIARFKRDLEKDEHNHYENWSDFEMGMANYAKEFINEDDFIACIRDFRAHMVKHLKNEERKYEFDPGQSADNLWESILHIHEGFTPNTTHVLEKIIRSGGYCNCSFIVFNYTHILDATMKIAPSNQFYRNVDFNLNAPIHIHRDLDNDVVLGADNSDQVRSTFVKTQKTDLAFIKPKFNDIYDSGRVKLAMDSIKNSSILCAFGFSLGKSDETWNKAIKEWLINPNQDNHLIYYYYNENEEEIPAYDYDVKIEKESELKNIIFQKLGLNNEEIKLVLDRVHIPINRKIFDFNEKTSTKELMAV